MKDASLRLILKDMGGKHQFVGSNLGVEIFLKNGEHQNKAALKYRRLRLLYTLCVGVSRKFHIHYTYVLAKILQNGANFIQKLTPGFKRYMTNLDNLRQAVESTKSWNLMGFCPKNTFVQKIHSFSQHIIYRGFISHYFQLLLWKFTKFLIYVIFWNHKSLFTTQLFYIFFSSNITYFQQK